MTKWRIILTAAVIVIIAVAVGVRWLVKMEDSGLSPAPEPAERVPGALTPFTPADKPPVSPPTPLAPVAPAEAADTSDEDFDPYDRCEGIDDPEAWVACTDQIDEQVEALEEACEPLDGEAWADCMEAAGKLQPYRSR